jgi:phosphoserine phosphatase RsbU/P
MTDRGGGQFGRSFRSLRLRTQLLLVVNLVVGTFIAVFLVVDYHNTVESRALMKEASLRDEARMLVISVRDLTHHGREVVQSFIDATCMAMNESDSPGHTIEVHDGETVYRTDPSLHGGVALGNDDERVIVGEITRGDLSVRVSERSDPVLHSARQAALGRAGALLLTAVIAGALVNILLIRLVTRPLEGLVQAVRTVARGDFQVRVHAGSNRELSTLSREISVMGAELARRERDRRSQMERANRLQQHLMRSGGGLDDTVLAVAYHPAEEVAGDFVDVIKYDNGDLLLCVADVVDHGIAAAMGSAILKALLLSMDTETMSPAEILTRMNERFFHASLPEDFASMILVRVRGDGSQAVIASAGHETCFLLSKDGSIVDLSSTGLLLGVLEDANYDLETVELRRGDVIVLISDGVTEAKCPDGKLLGREAAKAAIEGCGCRSASDVAAAVVEAVEHHRGGSAATDDVTIVALCVDGVKPSAQPDHTVGVVTGLN